MVLQPISKSNSLKSYALIFEHLQDGVLLHKEEKLIHANKRARDLLRVENTHRLTDKSIDEIFYPRDLEKIKNQFNVSHEKGFTDPIHVAFVGIDGNTTEITLSSILLTVEGEPTILSVATPIYKKDQKKDVLEERALYDPLTNLPNRVLFSDRFSLEMDYAHRYEKMLGVISLNLDGFKYLKNTLGYATGDKLIKLVANRLKHILRKTDTIYRLGGDEFILLSPGLVKPEGAAIVAQKLFDVFKDPLIVGTHTLYISISIGISIYPNDGDSPESLIQNANIAMYKAKTFGGNNYQFFKQDMHITISNRMNLLNYLRQAVENNDFELYYQPKVDVKKGIVFGMEALIRWHHKELGWVSPVDFIPIAEETGLIIPIGDWVLRRACNEIKEWHDKGLPKLEVAVNLSARQLQPDLIDNMKNILKETGLPPKYLEIELTESAIAHNLHIATTLLKELKKLGISLSMDDFGTGYSCLTHLKAMDFDNLKIDKGFVDGLSIDNIDDDFDIILAILSMARNLKIQTVAEGVETEDQLRLLKKLKCNYIQGYFYSKPMPLSHFEKFVKGELFLSSYLNEPSSTI